MSSKQKPMTGRDVYIVDGSRTPFLKAKGKPGPFSAADLAVGACRPLLARQSFAASDLDEVIVGCVMPSPDETNIGRVVALRLGCGFDVPAWTVQRNCASGMQALDSAAMSIASGRSDLVLAGGTDAMSHAPLLFNKTMVNWLGDWNAAKTWQQRLKLVGQLRLSHFAPVIGLVRGLTDPIVGLSMGHTAENVAFDWDISRAAMDEYAVQSHQRLAAAVTQNHLPEIETLYDYQGHIYQQDDGLREDSAVAKLAKLKPFFDKTYGMVTAANSSQVTDGAAFLILASAEAIKRHQLPVLGKIVDTQWSGLDPAMMGLGPAHAIGHLLERQRLELSAIDYFEINEAFAAQVLGSAKALANDDYCRNNLGLAKAVGQLPLERLNVDGGAIALGHPVGASGARIVLHLAQVLRRNQAKRGIASLCIGGGQGGAMLIESISEVI